MKVLFCCGSSTSSKRRRRIAAKIRADLVQFIQQDDRVAGLDAAQGLNDAAGQRADIGAAVAANLGFVAQAAEGDAGELAAERVGHAFAQGGLAHAGRADQTKDRALEILLQLDDGDEFEQPVLDLFQTDNAARRECVRLRPGRSCPRSLCSRAD